MLAAQIQNLPPVIPVQVVGKRKRRTGGGDWPESNLYDPLEGDPHNEFFDVGVAAQNAARAEQAELAAISEWAGLLYAILLDQETVLVETLEASVDVLDSGVDHGETDPSASPKADLIIDVWDTDWDTVGSADGSADVRRESDLSSDSDSDPDEK